MTDEIKITRRIALEKYEFYEIQVTTAWPSTIEGVLEDIEINVKKIREKMGEPSPEISPEPSSDDPYSDLLVYDGNTVRLNKYLKDKEKWGEINTYLKGLGYTWVGAGKDSRWER